ncbi:hypothetical protein [Paraburkholderia bonniea]|uniref:hypothetical protein n=1 Tax=Paraburkholderia bonniea TaxID=2152891 RepID=UPI001290CB56|nr:hypothetical protein [Paraburkholderia bonniea]
MTLTTQGSVASGSSQKINDVPNTGGISAASTNESLPRRHSMPNFQASNPITTPEQVSSGERKAVAGNDPDFSLADGYKEFLLKKNASDAVRFKFAEGQILNIRENLGILGTPGKFDERIDATISLEKNGPLSIVVNTMIELKELKFSDKKNLYSDVARIFRKLSAVNVKQFFDNNAGCASGFVNTIIENSSNSGAMNLSRIVFDNPLVFGDFIKIPEFKIKPLEVKLEMAFYYIEDIRSRLNTVFQILIKNFNEVCDIRREIGKLENELAENGEFIKSLEYYIKPGYFNKPKCTPDITGLHVATLRLGDLKNKKGELIKNIKLQKTKLNAAIEAKEKLDFVHTGDKKKRVYDIFDDLKKNNFAIEYSKLKVWVLITMHISHMAGLSLMEDNCKFSEPSKLLSLVGGLPQAQG